jgi:hypothetical protein
MYQQLHIILYGIFVSWDCCKKLSQIWLESREIYSHTVQSVCKAVLPIEAILENPFFASVSGGH